ncbi:MAG: sulfatase [TACK group archaeon]|nr:sulfatase [TACK group archaeon]
MKVVLVVMDTLRTDHLGCYGYGRNTSPAIDEFSKESSVFEDAVATDVPTQPSFTALMTGLRGIHNGVVSHHPVETIEDSVPLLQERLGERMVTGAVSTLYLMKKYFARGFHYYMNPAAASPSRVQRVQAEEINSLAIPWLRQHARADFFLFVHYWDPHTPYLPPERYRSFYRGRYNDPENHSLDAFKKSELWYHALSWLKEINAEDVTDLDYVVSLYDGEIRHADDAFGELLATLDDLGIAEETMVVLTADHGESLGEHGFYFDHGDVYQTTIRVPLIVRWPGRFPRKRVRGLVQSVDLTRTVLDLAGLPLQRTDGKSLIDAVEGKPRERAFSNQVLWTAKRTMIKEQDGHRYKVIVTRDASFWPTPRVELYDLSRDPKEERDLGESQPDLRDQLELELRRWEEEQLNGRIDPLTRITDLGLPSKVWVENALKRYRDASYEQQRNLIDAPKGENKSQ